MVHHATQFFNVMAELARGTSQTSVEPVWDRVMWLGHRKPPRVEVPLEEVLLLDKVSSPYQHSGAPTGKLCFQVKDEVKASRVPCDQKGKFAYSINIRELVNPPLPAGYWGNGCVPLYAQLIAKELVEQSIWRTAELIKKSKR
ncbi:hypothetical protein Ancab_005388 [Ancistrocladus abbreviatus]